VIATIVSGLLFSILWSATGMNDHIPSRRLTFFIAGAVTEAATFALPKKATNPAPNPHTPGHNLPDPDNLFFKA
jgi:hypothetical protein